MEDNPIPTSTCSVLSMQGNTLSLCRKKPGPNTLSALVPIEREEDSGLPADMVRLQCCSSAGLGRHSGRCPFIFLSVCPPALHTGAVFPGHLINSNKICLSAHLSASRPPARVCQMRDTDRESTLGTQPGRLLGGPRSRHHMYRRAQMMRASQPCSSRASDLPASKVDP